jgi:hypothetical protein
MVWLRRMYARPLFVVVGIFGPVLAGFSTVKEPIPERLGIASGFRIYACA